MTIKIAKPEVYLIAHTTLAVVDEQYNMNDEGYLIDKTDPNYIPTLEDFFLSEKCDGETDICKRAGLFDNDDLYMDPEQITDLDILPEIAGRVCYDSYGRKKDTNSRYVGHIIEVGHGSVLEHSTVTLAFTGVSRTLTHELVRHRLFGYSQRSQRFVNEDGFEVVMPPLFHGQAMEEEHAAVQAAANTALETYKKIADDTFERLSTDAMMLRFAIREGWLSTKRWGADPKNNLIINDTEFLDEEWNVPQSEKAWLAHLSKMGPDDPMRKAINKVTLTSRRKTAREAARSVLPNATETKIFMTGNLRAWRTMLDQRASIHADREIRGVAMKVLKIMQKIAPNVFADYETKVDSFGVPYAEAKHRKV
jgi:thymidylate synthase (FAD)